ncbi:hypothetical protein CEUSTIGMA_g6722.t1 [Chlamydomonas eustigma]|uniref:Probable magnesium transporter n=1 Tax=Chlamydomonas eustigma TaxID=1157962 RepID=A0A250X8R8_9CHLO|nr:hypothetical protein CEUSTIGMA_g6722.t1 [Chlamydomonas eustigma]|eukprot:GAX79282.1 hypothetical protein CEUSTIGMA_g6722.t1 [Chlamydomonas eustigma]
MWFAILVTVLAASGNNIGKVLQKQATRTLPKFTLKKEVIEQYLASRTWTAGLLTDLGGAVLMIVAFANAPVSVVQPVSAVGLVVLLIFSHFFLKERLLPLEWASAGVAAVGVLGLGASSEPDHLEHPAAPAAHIVLSFLGLVAILAAECWWRHWGQSARPPVLHPSSSSARHVSGTGAGGAVPGAAGLPCSYPAVSAAYAGGNQPGSSSSSSSSASSAAASDAALCGLEAGSCFGLSAAACRTGFILARKLSIVWIPLGLCGSVALSTSGFILQTRGLKAGNTIIVCTLAAVASMVSGVVAGLLALQEKMPSGHGMKLVRLGSWLCILLGVTSLAGGKKGMELLLRVLSSHLPPPNSRIWPQLPRPVALMLLKLHKAAAAASEGSEADDIESDSSTSSMTMMPATTQKGVVAMTPGPAYSFPGPASYPHHQQYSHQQLVSRGPSSSNGGAGGQAAVALCERRSSETAGHAPRNSIDVITSLEDAKTGQTSTLDGTFSSQSWHYTSSAEDNQLSVSHEAAAAAYQDVKALYQHHSHIPHTRSSEGLPSAGMGTFITNTSHYSQQQPLGAS